MCITRIIKHQQCILLLIFAQSNNKEMCPDMDLEKGAKLVITVKTP